MKKEKNLIRRVKIFVILLGVWYILTLGGLSILAWENGGRWIAVVGFAIWAIFMISIYPVLWKPYVETTRIIKLFGEKLYMEEIPLDYIPYNEELRLTIERLNKYTQTFTALEMSEKQAQYVALQNQINPHFLYNTLESIRSEALISGLDSVAQMCESLANFFRYTISKTENLVTIGEELQNIKTYFYIQKYRFGDRLHLNIDNREEDSDYISQCCVPKLTLQPIVENAIIHGIEKKIGRGTVNIQMTLTEKRLLINVRDDGVGIEKKSLDKINRRMVERTIHNSGRGGLAIANVNNRIKMLFGEEYGVTVFSTVEVGTDVEITLPHATRRTDTI